ncbi:integrase [Spirochaetia bacterium]|nr:integrase [Spirochaetia bacterium]
MRYEEPMKIIEMLRLGVQGYSQREIAQSVNCGKSTVGEAQKRCRAVGLTYETAVKMTDDQIKRLLYPQAVGGRPEKAGIDWEAIQKKLDGGKRVKLRYVWESYRQDNPDGLGYSQFCCRYKQWRNTTGKDVVMVQEREPGKELFVDWAGDTLGCVVDSETGKLRKAHFFIATLGDSGYPVVEAFPDEKQESWLTAHVHTFAQLGGLPRVIVPDNCKTAVTKANYYDPAINKAYHDLAAYYQVAVIPARVRAPRDKGQVEGSVGWIETWLLEWLRDQRFESYAELNGAIKRRMADLVKRPFQKRAGSRESVFLALDKPALRPLPQDNYEYAHYIERRVPDNYHIEYNGFYYSTPHQYYRQQVTMKVSATMVEVYSNTRQRIAIHERRYTGKRYVTIREHMPPNHQFTQDRKGFDGKRYRQWAGNIGVNTRYIIDTLLTSVELEETAYRSCMGILQFSKKQGNDRLEAACKKARELGSCSYTTVSNILKNHLEQVSNTVQAKPTAAHGNIRGASAFA